MGNRLSRIYTRTGDDGTTGLGDGRRVRKDDARVAAYGTVDEANSAIGVILSVPGLPGDVERCLIEIQHDLFDLGGELCIPGTKVIKAEQISQLEQFSTGSMTRCLRSRTSSCRAGAPAALALSPGENHRAARRALRMTLAANEQVNVEVPST
jgi:cob(I)alamin adenosyltransferase